MSVTEKKSDNVGVAAFQSEVVTATFSSGPVPVGNICFFNSYMYNHQVTIFFLCYTV